MSIIVQVDLDNKFHTKHTVKLILFKLKQHSFNWTLPELGKRQSLVQTETVTQDTSLCLRPHNPSITVSLYHTAKSEICIATKSCLCTYNSVIYWPTKPGHSLSIIFRLHGETQNHMSTNSINHWDWRSLSMSCHWTVPLGHNSTKGQRNKGHIIYVRDDMWAVSATISQGDLAEILISTPSFHWQQTDVSDIMVLFEPADSHSPIFWKWLITICIYKASDQHQPQCEFMLPEEANKWEIAAELYAKRLNFVSHIFSLKMRMSTIPTDYPVGFFLY